MTNLKISYKCKDCEKKFDKNWKLNVHIKTHTKPHICGIDDCKESFSIKSNLTRHKLTHTGEKPYICDYNEHFKQFLI